MDWSDVGDAIKGVAGDALPLIGSLLLPGIGGKVGAIAAKALGVKGTPDAVIDALKSDPQALAKLKEAEMQNQLELAKLATEQAVADYKHRTASIEAVNKTIQAEAVGRDWLQRNSHPLCVIMSVLFLVAVYFVLPLSGLTVPSVPADAWLFLGAVLGIGTYHNGVARRRAVSGASGVSDEGILSGILNKK